PVRASGCEVGGRGGPGKRPPARPVRPHAGDDPPAAPDGPEAGLYRGRRSRRRSGFPPLSNPIQESRMKPSLWHSLLGLVTLGVLPLGCTKPEAPPPAADVTLLVPAMN